MNAFDNDDLDCAINEYNKAIEQDPNNAELYLARGMLQVFPDRQLESGIDDLSKAIRLDPSCAAAYCFRGIAYAQINQKVQAKQDLEKAISLNLDDSLIQNANEWLSQIALEDFVKYVDDITAISKDEEKCKEAIRKCDETLKLNPNDISSLYKKEFCLNTLHKYNEAVNICNKLIELEPNNKSVYNSKGTSLHSLEKYEEAITCFEKVIEFDPQDYDTYTWIGMCFEKLHKYKEAISSYDKALEINPDWDMAQTYKKSCLSILGDNTNK